MNETVRMARDYLGTPYHHQARLKGHGIDCVGLVVCVARELGVLPFDVDVTGYSRIPDGKALMHHLHAHMDLPLREAYEELCRAQLKKALREHGKHTDFWKDLEREVQ